MLVLAVEEEEVEACDNVMVMLWSLLDIPFPFLFLWMRLFQAFQFRDKSTQGTGIKTCTLFIYIVYIHTRYVY